ncbi:SdpI family protein [Sediminitomix flava]|uniref:Putative membrane protein n=1 Tax=Sediminitomix flava TaxID=379075 RepID=A0A315Z6X1_SEDFL|nr:SdpI family protein [Sediminitomix flava]PWJ39281.1 putative membrane protein [Sediminitomix flava]
MKNSKLNEGLILLFTIVPLIYLFIVFDQLSEQVPIHFNIKGEADNFADKSSMWWIVALMMFGTYLLMKVIPFIDPKNKNNIGASYPKFRLMMAMFMSALACFIIRVGHVGTIGMGMDNVLAILLSVMMIGLGNYLTTIKPNYFVGLRTPWTLENETVWRKSHRMSGKLGFALGFVALFLTLLLSSKIKVLVVVGIMLIWAFYSIYYSYKVYQQEK